MARRQNPKIERTLKRTSSLRLVKEPIAIRDIEKRRSRNYDQCWVVFDKDDFSDGDFNAAIQMAQTNGFHVAYSNQAFEYWFLLHFNLYQGSIHRSRYGEMLSHLLGFKYGKTKGDSVRVFNVIYPKTRMAIDNAQKILESFDGSNPAKEESSTTVHQLVEQLLQFIE